MEECELCGKKINEVVVVEVEDVEMNACLSCAKGKKIVRREGPGAQPAKRSPRPTYTRRELRDEEKELVDGYGAAIRSARERMKIPLPVLAAMLNEKEPLLLRIEEERTKPTVELTRKLERSLKIKLYEEVQAETSSQAGPRAGRSITIGDMVGSDKED